MIILAIETSGQCGDVVLWDGDTEDLIAERMTGEGEAERKNLVMAIADVLDVGGLENTDVDVVGVTRGPGAFTSLRVGITCAKTLAYILGWETVGVSTLEVMVQNVDAEREEVNLACPIKDARRSAVFGQIFRWEGGRWIPETDLLLEAPQKLYSCLPEGTLVLGDGVEAYPEIFCENGGKTITTGDNRMNRCWGRELAPLALREVRAGRTVSAMELEPKYHRRSAAEDNLCQNGKERP